MAHVPAVAIALLSVGITVSFYFYQVLSPSSGARLKPGGFNWLPEGVRVEQLVPQPDGLATGDMVIAIEGVSLADWARDLFSLPGRRQIPAIKNPTHYSVLRAGLRQELTISPGPYPLREVLARQWGAVLFAFASQVIATFVYLRRPKENAARVLFIWAWAGSHTYAWSLGLQPSDITGVVGFWLYRSAATGLWLVYWPAILHFALIFPKPHPILRRSPRVIYYVYLGSFLLALSFLAVRWLSEPNTLLRIAAIGDMEFLIASLYLLGTIILIMSSYRKERDFAARQKIRWVVYGGLFSGVLGLVNWLLPLLISAYPVINANLVGLIALPFPLALAIAIARHQLFDIDILINRTLVYGTLTATLAVVYFSTVIALQRLLPPQTQLATVLSTLTIAALFSPLRRRIQSNIDRRFFRRKYNTEKALEDFNLRVQSDVDLESLSGDLLALIDDTMHPSTLALWIRDPQNKSNESPFTHL